MKYSHLLLTTISLCVAHAEDAKSTAGWDTATAAAARIAVPKGWRSFDGIQPTMPIYRQGDGVGVPNVDETGAPVQIGLTVEKFPPENDDTATIAKEIAKGASRTPGLEMIGKDKIETIVLSDRTNATLVTNEFIKGSSRRSLYMKLVAKSDKGDVWVATGYIVAGKNSDLPTPKGVLAGWLRSHVLSLNVSGKEIDPKPLEVAYVAQNAKQAPDPDFNITGKWSGGWQESDSESIEAFTMELRQSGGIVDGTAIFMDANRTAVTVSGEATGAKIRLVMTPAQPSLPTTTWIGTVTGHSITGSWYLHGRSSSSNGSWSATAAAKTASKDSP